MGAAPSSAATHVGGTTTTTTTILGKYVLGHLLGRGGFAHVYYAQSVKDNSSVAIKIFDKRKMNADSPRLIRREVAIMHRLNHHPNIIRIHELLATKTKIYLIMELAHGGDLFAKLARPDYCLPYVDVLRLFHQLVSAVHFCHHHGVAHRDIKPQNILLDKAGNVKLSDFGLSTMAGVGSTAPTDLLKTACGTPAFMAPEVIERNGIGYEGSKADAWSCGVILYAMLFGELPFYSKDLEVMHTKMISRQYRCFPSNSLLRPITDLIHRLLDPDPMTRLSIREIANDPWFMSSKFGHAGLPLRDVISATGRDTGFGNVSNLNAFDMAWVCYGLDLPNEFGRRRKRFTVEESAGRTLERAVEVGRTLGYEVEGQKDGNKVWMRRATALLVVEVLEVASESLMVDVEVVEGCRGVACAANGSGGDNRIEEVLRNYAT